MDLRLAVHGIGGEHDADIAYCLGWHVLDPVAVALDQLSKIVVSLDGHDVADVVDLVHTLVIDVLDALDIVNLKRAVNTPDALVVNELSRGTCVEFRMASGVNLKPRCGTLWALENAPVPVFVTATFWRE